MRAVFRRGGGEEKRAGGFVLPNDRVDVLLTRTDPESQKNGTGLVTETILTNVLMLAIGQVIEDKENRRSVAGRATATLELSPRQSEILASAYRERHLSRWRCAALPIPRRTVPARPSRMRVP